MKTSGALGVRHATAALCRGFSFRKLGRFQDAIVDYSRAIELNPSHCRAYYNRAFSHDRSKSYAAAIADYTQVRGRPPAPIWRSNGSRHTRQPALPLDLLPLSSGRLKPETWLDLETWLALYH